MQANLPPTPRFVTRQISSAYTAVAGDFVIVSGGTFTVTLPPAANGIIVDVKNYGSGVVTVVPQVQLSGLSKHVLRVECAKSVGLRGLRRHELVGPMTYIPSFVKSIQQLQAGYATGNTDLGIAAVDPRYTMLLASFLSAGGSGFPCGEGLGYATLLNATTVRIVQSAGSNGAVTVHVVELAPDDAASAGAVRHGDVERDHQRVDGHRRRWPARLPRAPGLQRKQDGGANQYGERDVPDVFREHDGGLGRTECRGWSECARRDGGELLCRGPKITVEGVIMTPDKKPGRTDPPKPEHPDRPGTPDRPERPHPEHPITEPPDDTPEPKH